MHFAKKKTTIEILTQYVSFIYIYQHTSFCSFLSCRGEFWLGNDHIHLLTKAKDMILRIELEDFEGVREYAKYDQFYVANEYLRYRLSVSGYRYRVHFCTCNISHSQLLLEHLKLEQHTLYINVSLQWDGWERPQFQQALQPRPEVLLHTRPRQRHVPLWELRRLLQLRLVV